MLKKLLTGCLSRECILEHLWPVLGRGMGCHTVGLECCLCSGLKQGSRSSCDTIVGEGDAELQMGNEAPSVSSQHLIPRDIKDVLK